MQAVEWRASQLPSMVRLVVARSLTSADAPHAFHADYRPSYRKEAAEDGWKRCLEWFKSHGVA